MNPLDGILYATSLILQGIVLLTILNGAWREYIGMMLYCGFLMLSTMCDVTVLLMLGIDSVGYYRYIWTAELVRQTCQLAFVLTLVFRALPMGRLRGATMRGIIAAALLLWAGSLAIYYTPRTAEWLNKVIRNVSFTSALVDLVLWFALVAYNRRDLRLLMISGGLGIQMTGDAIAQSLRQFRSLGPLPQIVSVLSYFLCMFIWWQAFRTKDNRFLRQ